MCFADNARMRSLLIRRKVIRSKYLPEELYPESNLQPKWYKEWKIKQKKIKSKAAELNVQLQAGKKKPRTKGTEQQRCYKRGYAI